VADQLPEPLGFPIYLDDREPEIDDPAEPDAGHRWLAANPTTSKLARCLEAFRDLKPGLRALASVADPAADKRAAKQLVVPVYNLAVGLRDLFNDVQSNAWSTLSNEEKKALTGQFRLFGEKVPTDAGLLKMVRDKIGAHLDRDAFWRGAHEVWGQFDLRDVLEWIYHCVETFRPLLVPDVYAWSRDSGDAHVVSHMRFDGWEVRLLLEGEEPAMIVGLRRTRSPREGIARDVREVTAAWEQIALRLGTGPGTAG
jgi:hypothetical protein